MFSLQICLPGWGKIKHPGSSHIILQQAKIPPVNNTACAAKLANSSGMDFLHVLIICLHCPAEFLLYFCQGNSLLHLEWDLIVFNSWVRASVPRVIAGTGICKWVTRSLVVDDFVINRVRTREREDLSFPKKHALAEVRWHQIPRWECASCATARLEDRGLTKLKTRRNLSD